MNSSFMVKLKIKPPNYLFIHLFLFYYSTSCLKMHYGTFSASITVACIALQDQFLFRVWRWFPLLIEASPWSDRRDRK